MPSETNELLESVRRLLLIVVLLLGLGVATLGDVAVAVRGYTTLLPSIARVVGSVVVFTALVLLFSAVFQPVGPDAAD
jgi:polyferredoxin